MASLSVPERATITNMGAELGATTSIFPSDERTREYLRAQKRAEAWRPLAADPDAEYDEVIEIDLGALEPLVAAPSQPRRRGAGARGGGHEGGPGVRRELHQLLLPRPHR